MHLCVAQVAAKNLSEGRIPVNLVNKKINSTKRCFPVGGNNVGG